MRVLLCILGCAALLAGAEQRRATDPNVLAAESYLRKGDYAKAVEALELAARLEARDPELFVMLAVARLNLDDKAGARDACLRGLERFPESSRIASYYASLLDTMDALPQRVTALEAAHERWPRSAVITKALAKALLDARSSPARVGELLAAARAAMPSDPEVHYLAGRHACLDGKEAHCIGHLTRSLALTRPDNYAAIVLANSMMAVAEDRRENPERARLAFERAMAAWRKLPGIPPPEPPYQYVRFLLDQNEGVRARPVNSEILARCPDFAAAHLEEARFLFAEGKREQAARRAEAALRLTAGTDKVQLRAIRSFLVKTYSALGREAEARPHQQWVDANQ